MWVFVLGMALDTEIATILHTEIEATESDPNPGFVVFKHLSILWPIKLGSVCQTSWVFSQYEHLYFPTVETST